MVGQRGALEDQTTKIAAILKLSQQLTKSGVSSALAIAHPVEGFIYSGASLMTTQTKDLIEDSDLQAVVANEQTTSVVC